MTLYETIFKRRSVRKYIQEELLEEEILAEINHHLETLKQLDGQNAHFEIATGQKINNSKAPYFILAFCEANAEAYCNVGYCLEEMDLFIQSKGLGSLWIGMANLKAQVNGKDFCIMMAFGKTNVPLRSSLNQFKRLEISKISNIDNNVVRAAMLAPSAVNAQGWKLTWQSNRVAIEYCGRGLLKSILKTKFSKIDLGIITKHLEIALQHDGKTISSIELQNQSDNFCVSVTFD